MAGGATKASKKASGKKAKGTRDAKALGKHMELQKKAQRLEGTAKKFPKGIAAQGLQKITGQIKKSARNLAKKGIRFTNSGAAYSTSKTRRRK